ncbi:sporulation integral membrane protein YtvI [Risungbinella massiliensis]|uniref:sporulation integral membrane protein YtvI n=1 Tax=Risungbinella massiliensis TaxID=1329796 RepID=UPI0005CC8236|nr:sporulation integral membrane protein YtvI [Risungbinella massiliensis]
MTRTYWVGVTIRSIIVLAAVIVLYFGLSFSIPLLYPFLIGWLIAILIEPIISWMERKTRMPRWLAITILLVLLLSLLFTFLVALVSEIIVELANLAEQLPSFLNDTGDTLVQDFIIDNHDLKKTIDTVQAYLAKYPQQQQGIQDSIQQNIQLLTERITTWITDIFSTIGDFLSNLPYLLTVAVFITLGTFFISLDWPRLKKDTITFLPDRISVTVRTVAKDLRKALFGFIRAQLTLVSITGSIMLVGLLILQVEYAFTIALLTLFVDLLPYFGVGSVMVPWIIYSLILGNYKLAIGLGVIYLIILVVRQVIEPKLVASNVGLDPLLTLVALFVGLRLIGVLGLILGPVVTVIVVVLHRANVFRDIWRYIVGKRVRIEDVY